MGLLTQQKAIGEDATAVFNMLSGYSEPAVWNKLIVAPIWLRDRFIQLIKRERDFAKTGKKAFIQAKMNSLCDAGIIAALYEASAAGVKIDLVVRGICCISLAFLLSRSRISIMCITSSFKETSSTGKKAFIQAKMNSLCDAGIIAALYEASAAGVKIDLVVRGICCISLAFLLSRSRISIMCITSSFKETSSTGKRISTRLSKFRGIQSALPM